MISVFFGFVLGDDPIVKMIGLGLAMAVFLDATIVRLVLVPATMSCWATPTGGCPSGSTASCPTSTSRATAACRPPVYRDDAAPVTHIEAPAAAVMPASYVYEPAAEVDTYDDLVARIEEIYAGFLPELEPAAKVPSVWDPPEHPSTLSDVDA